MMHLTCNSSDKKTLEVQYVSSLITPKHSPPSNRILGVSVYASISIKDKIKKAMMDFNSFLFSILPFQSYISRKKIYACDKI